MSQEGHCNKKVVQMVQIMQQRHAYNIYDMQFSIVLLPNFIFSNTIECSEYMFFTETFVDTYEIGKFILTHFVFNDMGKLLVINSQKTR